MRKENGSEVVAKIPCRIAGPAGLTTASEVGVLEYCMSSFALSFSPAHVITDGTVKYAEMPQSRFPGYCRGLQTGEIPWVPSIS